MLAVVTEDQDAFWRAELNVTSNHRGIASNPNRFDQTYPRADVLLGSDSDVFIADLASPYGRGPDHSFAQGVFAHHARHGGRVQHISIDSTPDYLHKITHLLHSATQRLISDQHMPYTVVTKSDLILPLKHNVEYSLISDPYLAGYFTTNPRSVNRTNVHGYPRGLASPKVMRTALRGAEALQVARDRPHLLMAGCMTLTTDRSGGRVNKMVALRRQSMVRQLNCNRTHHEMMTSKFVASFRGNGPNNCRDWESLVAGAIPLVDHYAPLEELFSELPVVFVKDWKAVSNDALDDIWRRMQLMRFDVRKAYAPYWLWRLIDARSKVPV